MRPVCAIGHIGPLVVSSIAKAVEFYADLGMRRVMATPDMAILELRGGTHLILRRGMVTAGHAPFDLMVDDLDGVREQLERSGECPGPVRRGGVHRSFDLSDPDGHRVSITSSHAMGPV